MMTATGIMMLFSNALYYWLLPDAPLKIQLDQVTLTFELGWCYWLILVAGKKGYRCVWINQKFSHVFSYKGFLCLMVGGSISMIDLIYPHKFSTILEMDYGTPFDRHTIIEDSLDTKKKKKTAVKLEVKDQDLTYWHSHCK